MLRIISIFVLLTFIFASIATPAFAAISYLYDQNGNMTSDGTKCYEYNDANQLKKVKSCSNNQTIAEYIYDYNGKRIVKKEYDNGTLKRTVYSPNDEYETVKKPDGTTENTTYYKANDEVVAKKNPDGSINYYHNDHLGSNSVLTNQSGTVVEKTTYEPYGEVKSGGTKSKFQYTGQEKDQETGLNYYDARYYDPHIQRFVQPDTLLPDVYDPQQLNRYAYVRNNPLKYTDPTGHVVFLAALAPIANWLIAGAFATAALYTATHQQQTKAAITTVAGGMSQLASNLGKNITSTFNKKSTSPTTSQPTNNAPSNNKNTPQMQNPMPKIGPAIPAIANAADKLHGNDLRSATQTMGYYLRDINTHVIKKVGETTQGLSRYTKAYYEKMNVYMDPQVIGSKVDIRIWEHEKIGEYIFEHNGVWPVLNQQVERAVNVFR